MESERDGLGAKIECQFCEERGFQYNHNPNECKTCYYCGELGHEKNVCPSNHDKPQINPRKREREPSKSISRMVSIDNTHWLKDGQPVSIDVEKVTGYGRELPGWVVICVRPNKQQKKNRIQVIYSAKIRHLPETVKDYATSFSGLTEFDLGEQALPFEEVKPILERILTNRMIIGIKLYADFECLGLQSLVKPENRFEFEEHFLDANRDPIALRYLAYAFLGKRIQEFQRDSSLRSHDCIIDARVTLEIHWRYTQELDSTLYQARSGLGEFDSHQWVRDLIKSAQEDGRLPKFEKWRKGKKRKSQSIAANPVRGEDGNIFFLE